MSGHSKWKNNLHRKSSQDAKKSANFGKLSRAITIAILEGGSPDPTFNPRLRMAIDNAKQGSMPKDNIDRAIAKGSGPDKASLHTILYEIFAYGGVNMLVIATTDNPNRTNGEIRSLLERHGGKLGNTGTVKHLYNHCVAVTIQSETGDGFQDKILGIAEELQADDMMSDTESTSFFFPFTNYGKASDILKKAGVTVLAQPHVIYKPTITIELPDGTSSQLATLVELLEAHDDIHEVFLNVA
jgi:YebC/PmpR family DNA-binding regulatory protein